MGLHGHSHKALAPSLMLGAIRGGGTREGGGCSHPDSPALTGSWAELATSWG